MKNKNVAALEKIVETFENLKIELESILTQERDNFESHSDDWRDSDVGEEEKGRLDDLEEAVDNLDSTITNLQAVTN